MILHENRLLVDDSREISCIVFVVFEKRQNFKLSFAANYRQRFKGSFAVVLGNFACFCCRPKPTFSKNSFRNTIREPTSLDPD